MKRPASASSSASAKKRATTGAVLTVARRSLKPHEVIFGGIWVGPGAGPNGDGCRPDLGQANADDTVCAAVAAGIQEFDTAPWYGAGSSEERLGRAIRNHLSSVKIVTKVGRLVFEKDGSPALSGFDRGLESPLYSRFFCNDYSAIGTKVSLSHSLNRLGLQKVWGLRIHDPNDNSCNNRRMRTFQDEVATALGRDGMCAALRQLRQDGIIEHVGLGMNCNLEAHQGVPDEILRLINGSEPGTFNSALLAGGWNLLSQTGLPCYAECERHGIEVHVAGVFASGLLVDSNGTYAYCEAPSHMKEKAEKWRALATKHGYSLPAVAIAFAVLPKCVTRVVIGMATAEQVKQSMAYVEESNNVLPELWIEAKKLGLLEKNVPTPTEK